VLPAVESDLALLKKNFAELETLLKNPQTGESWLTKRVEYDYAMVVEKLEEIQAPMSYSWGVVSHLMGVKNSDEIREVHKSMQPHVIEAYQKIGQSQPLFTGLSILKNRKSIWETLDPTQQRIVSSAIRQMEDSGIGLSGEQVF
jgi:oligopeptidase A